MPKLYCSGCPSFMTREKVVETHGKDLGAPMCARYNHVLSLGNVEERGQKKMLQHFAEKCDSYGKPRPIDVIVGVNPKVAHGNNDLITQGVQKRTEGVAAATACTGCEFAVSSLVTNDTFGWPMLLCAATGNLVWNTKTRETAEACSFGIASTTPGSAPREINLLDAFDAYGKLEIGDYLDDFMDPLTMPSEREPTSAELAMGIRGFFMVHDPDEYGPPIEVPMMNLNRYDEQEAEKVPRTGEDSHPEGYTDHMGLVYQMMVETYTNLDRAPLLIGIPGTGKTELIRHIAWKMVLPFDRIAFTKHTEVDHVLGTWLFIDGATQWKNGRIPMRWIHDGWLLLDEPNRGDEAVQEMMLSMFDNSKQLVLESAMRPYKDEDGVTHYLTPPPMARAQFAFAALAINPAWDSKNTGTTEFTQALIDRLAKIEIELPDEDTEKNILVRAYIEKWGELPGAKTLDQVMRIAKEIRSLTGPDGTLPLTWGLRPNIGVLCSTKYYRLEKAYMRTVGDYYEPETRAELRRIIANHAK